jgi:hypothetical protein
VSVVGWKAWYPDAEYSSRELDWPALAAARPRGLQVLVLYEDQEYAPGKPYRRQITNSRYIRWVDDADVEHWEEDDGTHVPEGTERMVYGPTARAIEGQLLPDAEFEALLERALEEEAAP